MSEKDPKLLDELSRSLRREPTPKLDFTRMEARLMREARSSAASPRKVRGVWLGAWAGLAAAFGALFWVSQVHLPASAERAIQAPPQVVSAVRDGDRLPLDGLVSAENEEVAVQHAGRAAWQLAPHSAARLIERAQRIVLRLESGQISSNVVPSARAETYIVEAKGTRVAVHGTAFRVTLSGDQVEVTVSEGVVAVGPLGERPRFSLGAGAHGTFSANGAQGVIAGPQPELSPALAALEAPKLPSPHAISKPHQAQAPLARSASLAQPLPLELAIGDIEAGVARVVQSTNQCFADNAQGAEGVRLTAHTSVALHITGAGLISRLDFQPPLAPAVDACARARIQQLRFARSVEGADVTRLLELNR